MSKNQLAQGDLLEPLLQSAIRMRASDIHIEPSETKFIVRLRVDGQLKPWKQYGTDQLSKLTTKIKVLAGMDITDRRLPQDGRFSIESGGAKFDFRVSTSPMVSGEKIVIRVLHKNLSELDFEYLGYSESNLERYKAVLVRPHGLVLHCGPTGSGKTTSLYTAINYLNNKARNIQTIEDPVEGRLPGINQAQVNADIGLSFASLLRAYLRQDCDIILVGEIRDEETAQLAVQAALTGHQILGTIHANTAVGGLTRLTEMGISPFFVGTAVTGVVNQRLVRKLCMACREPYTPVDRVRQRFRLEHNQRLYRPKGCSRCASTGFKGRLSIQEVLSFNDALVAAVQSSASEAEISKLARLNGMTGILSDGLQKALAGRTTVEEVTLVVKGVGMTAGDLVQSEWDRIREQRDSSKRRGKTPSTQPPSRNNAPVTGRVAALSKSRAPTASTGAPPKRRTSKSTTKEPVVTGVLLEEGKLPSRSKANDSAVTQPPRPSQGQSDFRDTGDLSRPESTIPPAWKE